MRKCVEFSKLSNPKCPNSQGILNGKVKWELGKKKNHFYKIIMQHIMMPTANGTTVMGVLYQIRLHFDWCQITLQSLTPDSLWTTSQHKPLGSWVEVLGHFWPAGSTCAVVRLLFDMIPMPHWAPLREVYWDLLSEGLNLITNECILMPDLEEALIFDWLVKKKTKKTIN